MANWPRVDANDVERGARRGRAPTARSASPTSPARPSSRSRSRARSTEGVVRPDTRFDVGPADPGRRPRDQGGARHRRHLHRVATSSRARRTSARSRSACELGARALRPLGAPFGFGALTGLPLPGESPGIVPTVEGLLRLLDREPADRPGPRRHADPDGRRLRGDRQRRHARQAAAGAGRRRRRRARRVISERTSARLRRMLEGVLGPDRHRARGGGRRLRHRRQDRHGGEGRERRLLQGQVRRLVHRLRARATTRSCWSR